MRRLAAPAILHSCLQTLVFVVDRAMLGHIGESSLAAMQIAGTLEWSLFSVLLAFEVGTIARVGFWVGAKRREDAQATALVSLGMATVVGALVMALAPLVVTRLAWIAPGASAATLAEARAYLEIMLPASPIVFVATTAVAVLQASGDTRTPLLVASVCNVLHVGLNRVLIMGAFGVPALGTRGCGLSTAATFALEGVLLLAALYRPRARLSLRGARAAFVSRAAEKAREIARVAVPSVLERTLYHAGFMGFVTMIGRLGDRVMASNQALITLESVCFLSADGFAVAAAALVAQKLGAGDPSAAARAARIATRDAVVVVSGLGVAIFSLRHVIVGLLVDDPRVIAVASGAVVVLMVAQPFMSSSIVLAQALRGAGQTRVVLAVTSFCALGVRLSATYFYAFGAATGADETASLRAVWWGSTTDWMVRAVLLVVVVRFALARVTAPRGAPAPS